VKSLGLSISQDQRLILGEIVKSPEGQGPERFFDRGVLTCTVRREIAENAVFSGESAVSNPAIAGFGHMNLLDITYSF